MDDKHFSAVYYLSATEKAQATPIEVSPGQTQSDIRLSAPTQETYSVRGIISTNEKPPKGEPGGVSVALIPLDGGSMTTYRWQTVQAVFPFANAEYFHFENVPPGRYAAFAQIYGDKWFTERVDVTVTNHSKFIFVKLTHNR